MHKKNSVTQRMKSHVSYVQKICKVCKIQLYAVLLTETSLYKTNDASILANNDKKQKNSFFQNKLE